MTGPSYWWLRSTIAATILVATVWVGHAGVDPVPPLGPFLDPWRGVWSAALAGELPKTGHEDWPDMRGPVRVTYDDRSVPHIFAENVPDAFRALGYVVARDRLFQMELSARASEGTLSELVGGRALTIDRGQRRWALRWSAERVAAALDRDSEAWAVLAAYADGVNHWIETMRPRDLPIEYRLLGVEPRRWDPLHSLIIIKRMGWTLARWNPDLRRLRVSGLVGEAAARALFPDDSPIQEPIQPRPADEPRFDWPSIPPPGVPDSSAARMAEAIAWFGTDVRPPEVLASNNWAVGPARTAVGNAVLAGDPHLELTLPSIWYEAHLVVPDTLEVYGVGVPGIPGVVIGFNRNLAWTLTNTGADVLDHYAETLDDDERPATYQLDGEARPLDRREEVYRDQRGEVLAVDTSYFTHRGPLLLDRTQPMSVRWTVYEDIVGLAPFLALGRARTVAEAFDATVEFRAPTQNFLIADREGHIGIRSTGWYPIRPDDGDGSVIRDGSMSASDWLGYWTPERYPQAYDPPQGYLASANQQPIDPRVEPAYLGADWPSPWRAMRINELLRRDSAVTTDAMRRYQTDPGSARADVFVPRVLSAGRRYLERVDDALVREALQILAEWDRRYTRSSERAVLFEAVMTELEAMTWDELRRDGRRVATPEAVMLAALLEDAHSPWWDRGDTPEMVESRDDIVGASLREGLRQVRITHGPIEDGGWTWEHVRHNNIYHLLGFPSFSATGIAVQGGPGLLNPSSGAGTHGASWRMVVELGDEIEACVTYPGGQSGNPMSPRYADRLAPWSEGRLDCARFPRRPEDLTAEQTATSLTFGPEARP